MKHRARWVIFGFFNLDGEQILYQIVSYHINLTKEQMIEKLKIEAKEDYGDVELFDISATFYEK